MTINKDYWNKFYSGADSKLLIPSQFGAFIAMEYLGKLQTVYQWSPEFKKCFAKDGKR